MYNLPRRAKELQVPIPGVDGVEVHVEPLTDEQYLQISEGSRIEYADEEPGPDGKRAIKRIVFPLSPHVGMFVDRLRSIPALQIGEETFDRTNPEHLEAIPPTWKAVTLNHLVRYAQGLTEEERGNSPRPAETSSTDTTHSPA